MTKYEKIESAIASYIGSKPIWIDWFSEADIADDIALHLKLPVDDTIILRPLFITAIKAKLRMVESEGKRMEYHAVCKLIRSMVDAMGKDREKMVQIVRHKPKGVSY